MCVCASVRMCVENRVCHQMLYSSYFESFIIVVIAFIITIQVSERTQRIDYWVYVCLG